MPAFSSNIEVSVRVRPFSSKELASNSRMITELVEDTRINLFNPKLEGSQSSHDHRDRFKQFTFDHCYLSVSRQQPGYASQQIIFNDIGLDVLKSFIEGYNTCILCYGQTGTGKTFTMMGNQNNEEMGLTPKICETLFKRIEDSNNSESSTLCFKTLISYMEIYNEKLRDLFDFDAQKSHLNSSQNSGKNLKIREHPNKGIYVQNLKQFSVSDLSTTMRYLNKGNQCRSTASTHVHDKSSRSHAIFTITFIQAKVESEMPIEIISKLNLVDLAGSERASNDLVYNKKQLKEGSNINKSLVSLGNVISILAESNRKSSNFLSHSDLSLNKEGQAESKSSFVPYRDSLLTYLLKDSLGGNAKTHMIANISPASCCYHETLNTLLFAQRAKKIVNKLKINEDPKTALIKELKEEIFRLKELLSKSSSLCSMSLLNYDSMSVVNNNAISGSQLELILERNETKAQELTLSWIDKWNQTKDLSSSLTNSFLNSPSARSQKFSSGLILQSDLPFIVLINDDRLTAGIMIFYIKEGDTILGKDDNCSDISLNDKNLSDTHCIFSNTDSIVSLAPVDFSVCILNGTEIKLKTKLTQGDVIQVGKYTFRFNHPEESVKLRQSDKEMDLKILKSQSLPSLARSNLSNEGLLMAKCSKTNNSTKMEEFRSISRSSSFMSSKSDYSILEPRFKINSINEIRNDMKKLSKMKLQNNAVSDNSYGLLSQQFQHEQIKCKNDYDQKLKDWNEKISHTKSDAGHFDYENYFYSTLPNNKCLDYIDNFQTRSQVGQQKHRLILELKFFMNLKQLRLTFAEEMGRQKLAETVNKQTSIEMPIVGQHLDAVDLPAADAEAELNSSNISSASCPTLCASKCPNCSHMALKRSRSASDLLADKNLTIVLDVNPSQNNMMHANMDLVLSKKKVIIYNRGRARKNVRSVLKKPMKKTKPSSRKLTVLSLDSCVTGAKMVVADSESHSSSSRAPSMESSHTHSSSKNYKPAKHSVNNCCHRTKNCIDLDLHAHHHKHLFPFYFSYNLKDSDDDCLNKKTKNLFKSSMNRIDNTHATFLNCLRDWNDPFLHGHKPVKPYGCQRCESCACRSVHSSTNSLNRESCSNQTESSRHYPHSKLNKKIVQHELLTGFQPIIRCRSSANVPKTLNQCIKLAKPRSSPLYSRKILNNSKRSNNSIESDKESSDNVSKDEEFKVLFQSSPDISLTSKGTNELVQNNEMLRKTNMDKTERDEFMLAGSLRDTKDHDQSIEKHELQCLDNDSKIKLENGEHLINVLSSSTSSSIEDIAFDDSLQGDSFESDSLMLDCDKKQPEKKYDRSELKETSSCQAKSTFVSDQDSMSKMDLINLNIDEATQYKGCNNQSRPSSVQQGFKEIKSKRRVSLNDSIEDERNLLKKPSPNRSYSEGYLNDNNDTDIDQDFDCSNSDLSTNKNPLSLHMDPDQGGKARSGAKAERQSPIHQLEDQIAFYERVKDTFLANLDKPAGLSPHSSSPKRRRSTSSEQKFLHSDKLVYKVCDYADQATFNELTMQMPPEHRLVQSISVPAIVVHETKKENEKSIENFGCHGNRDQNIDKSIEQDSFQPDQIFKHQCDKFKRTKLCSFLSSASKKRHKMNDQPHQATCSTDWQNLRLLLDQELPTDDEEDEFFVAISSHSLQTGSCPEFHFHPGSTRSPKRARSQTDLVALKSYENITQSNYVQMINSMIHGAISDMTDPDYADYLKRHIQGLFDNFTPVLMKSKSNEEIAMASPSRHKISHIINQTMPKSLSFDFKLLEDNHSDDAMDFSKFGLGIKDHESSDDSMHSDDLQFSQSAELEDLIDDLIEQIESLDNFESDQLKSSTRINFDDLPNDTKLNASVHQASMDSTTFGSESCASTIVNVTLVKDSNHASQMHILSNQDQDVNLVHSSQSEDEDDSETRRLIPTDDDDDDDDDDGEEKSARLSDSLEDDVIIECKIDYRVKSGSDSESSFTDSDEMDKQSCSDYDNMKQHVWMSGDEPESAVLSTSVHSLNSVESAHNLVNETLASLTSLNSEQKSVDEEDEPEFIFGDDFGDLDENWLQEDDWFGGGAMGPAESMHSVRQLDPIAEEDERCKEEEIVLKKSQDLKDLFDNVENFKISLEYKYRPESEKLRSQECNIRSLLGSTAPTIGKQQSSGHSDLHDCQILAQKYGRKSMQMGTVGESVIDEESGGTFTDKVDYQQQARGEVRENREFENSESLSGCVEEVEKNCMVKVEKFDDEKYQVERECNNGQGSDNNKVQNDKNSESMTECFEEIQENCFLQVEIDHREQNDESLTSQESCDTLTEKIDDEEHQVEVNKDLKSNNSEGSNKNRVQMDKNRESLTECFEEVQNNCFLQVEIQHKEQNDESLTSQKSCDTLTENIDDEEHQVKVNKDLKSNNGEGSDNNIVQMDKNIESLTECFEEIQKNCFLQVEIEHRDQNDESLESEKKIDHKNKDQSSETSTQQSQETNSLIENFFLEVEVKHQNDELLTSQDSCDTLTEKNDDEQNQVEVHKDLKSKDGQVKDNKRDKNSENMTECFEEIQENCFLQVEIDHREQNDESLTSQESCETSTEKIDDKKHLVEVQNYLEIINGQTGEEAKKITETNNSESLTVSLEQIQKDCFLEVEAKHQNDESVTDKFELHEHLENTKKDLELNNGQTSDNNRDQKEKNNESLTECFEVIQKDCVFEVEIKHIEQIRESLKSPESGGTITEKNDCKKYLIESKDGQGSDNNRDQMDKNRESLTECFEEIQENCFLQVEIDHREQNDESLTSQDSFETLIEKNDHNKYLVENKNGQQNANNKVLSPTGCFPEIQEQEQNDDSLTSQTESSETLASVDSVVQLQINHDQIINNTFKSTHESKETITHYSQDTIHSLTESINNQSLTSWYEQIENDRCLLQVQIKHKEQNDESLTSQESCEQELDIKCENNESMSSDKFLNKTLTEEQTETLSKHSAKSKSCSSIETTSEKCDEMQKDSVLETRYCEWCESDNSSDAILSQKRQDMQKDSLLDTANGDDTSSSECQSADNVTDEEEIHVEYFEYVISNDLYEQVHAAECPIEKKCDSELDLSKLELNVMRDEETNTSDRLHQVLSDIDKQIEVKSPVSSLAHDKSYQVCPAELAVNMVDSQTQSTPPLSPIKKLGPAKKNAYTETDDSHIFSQFLITSEEQKLRQKLKEKENSLKQTTIGTQTAHSTQIEHLPALQNQRPVIGPQKIRIINDDTQSILTDLKLNVRQKIKIENLQGQGHTQGQGHYQGQGHGNGQGNAQSQSHGHGQGNAQAQSHGHGQGQGHTQGQGHYQGEGYGNGLGDTQAQSHGQGQGYGQGQGRLVKVTDDEFHDLPRRLKTTHLKCVDVQTEEEEEEKEEEKEERGEAGRTRSVSNSSTFIDLLSLNLDRSKTWVELTEAKLNYMIGETDAVLRSMNLDSSSSSSSSSSSDNDDDRHSNRMPKTSLTNSLNLNLNTTASSHTSPRIHLISPEHTLNCLTSTTKTIEEMTQLYLDNYKRQLEESRKELSSKMSLLEAEKEKIGKIRDSRKKELYMRRQAAIQAFKLERQRELTNSLNDDLNSHSESIVCDDLEEDEFSQTLNTSKRLLSNELPSHKREKLAKIRRDVLLGSALRPEPFVTPRLDATKLQNSSAAHSRLVIPVQKSYVVEEIVQTSRVEHTTSSSSNSSSIIDESRLLLKEYEQLRNDSVSEIQRAQDSLNASLLWLENQKQNRIRSLKENKPSKEMYHASYSKSRTESGRSSRSDSINSTKAAKTRELSPVSRFREEQKEYLLRVNTNNSSASNSNTNRKEIPISIYSPLSSSSFLSSPSSNFTSKRSAPSSNHKTRVDQVSKSNKTKITITDYSAKIPSSQPSYQRAGIPPPIPSHHSVKNKYRYISRNASDSDEDKIC